MIVEAHELSFNVAACQKSSSVCLSWPPLHITRSIPWLIEHIEVFRVFWLLFHCGARRLRLGLGRICLARMTRFLHLFTCLED
jgi:hypothetical protein